MTEAYIYDHVRSPRGRVVRSHLSIPLVSKHFVAECDRMTEAHGSRFEVSDWLRQRAENSETFHQL